MRHLYYLAALALTLTGCNAPTKPASLKGTYKFIGPTESFHALKGLEITDNKLIVSVFTEQALPYHVEDGFLYVGPEGGQFRFRIISPDTLRNEANPGMKGTYVRLKPGEAVPH
jgi:hypothetical protein